MAKTRSRPRRDRRPRPTTGEQRQQQTQDDTPSGEFDDIELPAGSGVDETRAEGEFEEPALSEERLANEELIAAKQRLEQQLLFDVTEEALSAEAGTDRYGFENIVGVGISDKLAGNDYTGQTSVTVYVAAKRPEGLVDPRALVAREVNGVPTDVVAIGELHALPHRGRYRPAPGGVSVGHYRITAGTVACLVRRGRQLFVLSNNHVLANSNEATQGDPIRQPGRADGGGAADVIATLSQWVPIRFGGPVNRMDAAIAQARPTLVTSTNRCFGRIGSTPLPCRRDLLVKKCGRTTQLTRGRVTDCDATVWVNYNGWRALFQNQMIIVSLTAAAFSAPGDSGSLILSDQETRPVGLLFAGSSSHTIASPIATVLAALNVSIVT